MRPPPTTLTCVLTSLLTHTHTPLPPPPPPRHLRSCFLAPPAAARAAADAGAKAFKSPAVQVEYLLARLDSLRESLWRVSATQRHLLRKAVEDALRARREAARWAAGAAEAEAALRRCAAGAPTQRRRDADLAARAEALVAECGAHTPRILQDLRQGAVRVAARADAIHTSHVERIHAARLELQDDARLYAENAGDYAKRAAALEALAAPAAEAAGATSAAAKARKEAAAKAEGQRRLERALLDVSARMLRRSASIASVAAVATRLGEAQALRTDMLLLEARAWEEGAPRPSLADEICRLDDALAHANAAMQLADFEAECWVDDAHATVAVLCDAAFRDGRPELTTLLVGALKARLVATHDAAAEAARVQSAAAAAAAAAALLAGEEAASTAARECASRKAAAEARKKEAEARKRRDAEAAAAAAGAAEAALAAAAKAKKEEEEAEKERKRKVQRQIEDDAALARQAQAEMAAAGYGVGADAASLALALALAERGGEAPRSSSPAAGRASAAATAPRAAPPPKRPPPRPPPQQQPQQQPQPQSPQPQPPQPRPATPPQRPPSPFSPPHPTHSQQQQALRHPASSSSLWLPPPRARVGGGGSAPYPPLPPLLPPRPASAPPPHSWLPPPPPPLPPPARPPAPPQPQPLAPQLFLPGGGGGAPQQLDAGLSNAAGEYNCFLNSLVQALFRLDCFREHCAKGKLDGAFHRAENAPSQPERARLLAAISVVDALQRLFASLSGGALLRRDAGAGGAGNGGSVSVDPTQLRRALAAASHSGEGGERAMADAAEALQTMYESFGRVSTPLADGTTPVQQLFSIALLESTYCASCGIHSNVLPYETYFLSASPPPTPTLSRAPSHIPHIPSLFPLPPAVVPAAALRECPPGTSLEGALSRIAAGDPKSCDRDAGGCGTLHTPRVSMTRHPRVFTLSVAWAAAQASEGEVEATMGRLRPTLRPAAAFLACAAPGGGEAYDLRAVVCFYGAHYLSFARTDGRGAPPAWTRFDDGAVTPVGDWAAVCAACARGHLQATVLFYEALRFAS